MSPKSKEDKPNPQMINPLFKSSLGYLPLRMKPVHFATSFFLCLHPLYRTLEWLNKASNPRAAEERPGDEYVAKNLYSRFITASEIHPLDARVTLDEFKLLRNHLNAAYNNDGSALTPAFKPYSSHGCDYSTPSIKYLANQSKNHGHSGAFVWLVLNTTTEGRNFLEMAQLILENASSPAAILGAPLIEEEEESLEVDITALCGDPSMEKLTNLAKLMEPQTVALQRLARNLLNYPSPYALRQLIVGVGSWLLLYQIRHIPGAENTIFFSDFAGETRPRLRTQASACYARQLSMFGISIQRWMKAESNNITQVQREIYFKYEMTLIKRLEEHFRDFSVRIGWVQPRGGSQRKFFRAVPDTLRVLLMSLLDEKEIITMDEAANRLQKHWGLVVGLQPEDHDILGRNGYAPLDEDADLQANREAFKQLAIQLGFAWEPSDGLVLFSLEPSNFF